MTKFFAFWLGMAAFCVVRAAGRSDGGLVMQVCELHSPAVVRGWYGNELCCDGWETPPLSFVTRHTHSPHFLCVILSLHGRAMHTTSSHLIHSAYLCSTSPLANPSTSQHNSSSSSRGSFCLSVPSYLSTTWMMLPRRVAVLLRGRRHHSSRRACAHSLVPRQQKHQQLSARWASALRGALGSAPCTARCARGCCLMLTASRAANTPFAAPASARRTTAPRAGGMSTGCSPTVSWQVRERESQPCGDCTHYAVIQHMHRLLLISARNMQAWSTPSSTPTASHQSW